MKAQFRRLNAIVDSRPDEAAREVTAMDALLAQIASNDEHTSQQMVRAKAKLATYAKRIELGRTSLDEPTKRIAANADGLASIQISTQEARERWYKRSINRRWTTSYLPSSKRDSTRFSCKRRACQELQQHALP